MSTYCINNQRAMNYQSLLLSILLPLLAFNLTFGQAKLGFSIQNLVVSSNTLEFDIYAVANVNNTFHSRGQVYLDYNMLAFGDSIVHRGNVSFTPLSLVSETVPVFGNKYSTIGFIDNSPSRLAITWQTNFPAASPTSLTHTLVPAAFTPLYHITMQIQNTTVPIQVSLAEYLMIGQQFHITAPNWEVPYHDWPLPVELMHFDGRPINDQEVQLDWSTSSEINNDHFVLEKRLGQQGPFLEIAQIEGAGTTDEPTFYDFIDRSPMDVVNYYRLKQVDIDGLFSYTGMVEVKFEELKAFDLTIYPNPTTDIAYLKLHSVEKEDFHYQLVDQSGKRMTSGQILGLTSQEEIQLDLTEFPAGVYYLQLVGPSGEVQYVKLVKI